MKKYTKEKIIRLLTITSEGISYLQLSNRTLKRQKALTKIYDDLYSAIKMIENDEN